MELRFIERFGHKILQYREGVTHDCEFQDVPFVKEEVVWCDHIKQRMSVKAGKDRWFFNRCGHDYYIADDWIACPICGAVKPSEAWVKSNKGEMK